MMKMIPLLRAMNMKDSVDFYTGILDFELKYPDAGTDDWVIDLVSGEAEIQLTGLEGDQRAGFAVNVRVDNIDDLFHKFLQRGLNTAERNESPVHQGPLDQSWGMREFYVTDPSGNTLRFTQAIDRSVHTANSNMANSFLSSKQPVTRCRNMTPADAS